MGRGCLLVVVEEIFSDGDSGCSEEIFFRGEAAAVKGTWPFWRGIFHCRTEGSFYESFEEATGRGFSVKVKSPLPFSRRFFFTSYTESSFFERRREN